VPADAPTAFVKPRWGRFVFKEGSIDRRFYELAAMSELKNALRSGDVSVTRMIAQADHATFTIAN